MTSRLYVILLMLPLIYTCADETQIYQPEKEWNTYIKEYQTINDFLEKENYVTDSNNYYINDSAGELKISVATNNNKIIVLKFPEFDVVGDFQGYAKIYFTKQGKPFIKIKPIQNNLLEVIVFNIDSASFYKKTIKTNDNLLVNKNEIFKDYDYQCEIIKLVDNLLHRFRNIPKYVPTICINNRADFLAITDSIPMYKSTSAQKPFKYILKGDSIKYLIVDSTPIKYRGVKCNYFLKIKHINSFDTGWVCLLNTHFIDISETD